MIKPKLSYYITFTVRHYKSRDLIRARDYLS